jgi:signal transduction histidine kinase
MGGSVKVESKVNEGSTFTINFKAMCKAKFKNEID